MARIKSLLLLACFVFTLTAPSVVAAERFKDKLIYKNAKGGPGTTVAADVRDEKIDENKFLVHYRSKEQSGKLTEETWKLYDIEIYDAPGGFKNARKSYFARDYNTAATAFEALYADKDNADYKRYKWIWPHVEFYLGVCYHKIGEYEKAIDFLTRITKEGNKTRHQAEAYYVMAEACGALGKTAEAAQALDALRALGSIYGPEWTARADMLDGNIKFEAGDWVGAGGVYRKVAADLSGKVAEAPQLLPTYTLARRRIGECLVGSGDRAGSKNFYQELTNASVPLERAVGKVGLAKLELEDGKLRNALFNFLDVYLTFQGDPGLRNDCMQGAGMAFAKLYQKEKFEGDKKEATKFANLLRAEGKVEAAESITSLLN